MSGQNPSGGSSQPPGGVESYMDIDEDTIVALQLPHGQWRSALANAPFVNPNARTSSAGQAQAAQSTGPANVQQQAAQGGGQVPQASSAPSQSAPSQPAGQLPPTAFPLPPAPSASAPAGQQPVQGKPAGMDPTFGAQPQLAPQLAPPAFPQVQLASTATPVPTPGFGGQQPAQGANPTFGAQAPTPSQIVPVAFAQPQPASTALPAPAPGFGGQQPDQPANPTFAVPTQPPPQVPPTNVQPGPTAVFGGQQPGQGAAQAVNSTFGTQQMNTAAGPMLVGQGGFAVPMMSAPQPLASFSEGYVPSAHRLPPYQFSMPSVGSVTKIVQVPDDQGIERRHPVDKFTLQQIRTLLLYGGSTPSMQPIQATSTFPSAGSLPSATSTYSLASGGNPAYPYVPANPSADPMSAIQQYCDMLLRSGRLQELATIKQYLEMNLQGASATKSGQVKYQDPVSQFDFEDINLQEQPATYGMVFPFVEEDHDHVNNEDDKDLSETSSGILLPKIVSKKPKKGVLKRFHSVFSRIFMARV